MTAKPPQDIQQRTFEFGLRIVRLVEQMPRTLASEVLARQLLRAGLSIGANMQEADGAETKKDFIHKICVAYKEARESRHWLATLKATIMKGEADIESAWKEADEIVRILFAILRKSRASANRPPHTESIR